MSNGFGAFDYPYLSAEDIGFARCFRLTESDFLQMAGGLRRYTQFRLDRGRARGASITAGDETKTFSVPRLPSNTEEAMAQIKVEGLAETDWAQHLLSEQMKTVGGIMSALKADREIIDWQARQAKDKEVSTERTLMALRQKAASIYNVSADSQTAKDYAEEQLKIQSRKGY